MFVLLSVDRRARRLPGRQAGAACLRRGRRSGRPLQFSFDEGLMLWEFLMSTRYTLARHTPGAGLKEHESQIDMRAMRAYRLNRVREQLIARDYGACVLFNPYNIRYATGARNLQVFSAHSPGRYLFLPADGPVILFDPWIVGDWPNPVETIDVNRSGFAGGSNS